MRGMVLAGAMGVLLAVSAGAQGRHGVRGNGDRGLTVRVHPRSSGWYGSSYGSYWRLDAAGRPFARVSRSYGAYSQPYAYGTWADDEDGDAVPEYHSLSRVRYQRSSRGYYILPPNFAATDDEPETEGR